jgi:hypothetical protein
MDKMIKKCYCCPETLEGKYNEHIIPNAIGGKITSKDLLCTNCGNKFSKIDNAIIEHCKPFATLMDVQRDRNENQDIEVKTFDGESFFLTPNLKMKPNLKGLDQKLKCITEDTLYIEAKGKEEYKNIVKYLEKTYPNDLYKLTIKEKEFEDIKRKLEISGDGFKGVCKIALGYYLYSGGSINEVKHLIPFLKGISFQRPTFLYYPKESCFELNNISHSIYVQGLKKYKLLYSIVNLFGVSSFLNILNLDYSGEDFETSYNFDLQKQAIQKWQPKCNIFDISDFINNYNDNQYENMLQIFQNKVDIFIERLSKIRTNIIPIQK